MFKGLASTVPRTELNLTIAHQQSATNHSGSAHKGQDTHSTASVAMETSRLCCNNRKCNWNGAKWNSCTDPHEQVLLRQPFPGRVAVYEHLQSHRPEWQQLKTPKYSTGSFPNSKPAGARGWILASTAEVKKDMDTCTPPNTPVHF